MSSNLFGFSEKRVPNKKSFTFVKIYISQENYADKIAKIFIKLKKNFCEFIDFVVMGNTKNIVFEISVSLVTLCKNRLNIIPD